MILCSKLVVHRTLVSRLVAAALLILSATYNSALSQPARTVYVASSDQANLALARAQPGSHVVVQNGSYSNWSVNLVSNGTAFNPITFRAESPGQVTFAGATAFTITGDYQIVRDFVFNDVPGNSGGGNVVRFSNSTGSMLTQNVFIKCGAHRWRHIVLVESRAHDTVISFNKFAHSKGQGIGVKGRGTPSLRTHIHHNHLDGVTNDGLSNGQEPIQLGQAGYNNDAFGSLVEYNLIENMGGDADPEMISVKLRGSMIRLNTLKHAVRGGPPREIVLRNAAESIVEQNLLYGVGIRAFGPGHSIRENRIVGISGHPRYGIRLPRWNGRYPDTRAVQILENLILNTRRQCIGIADGDVGNRVEHILIRGNTCISDRGTLYFAGPTGIDIEFIDNTASGRAVASVGISQNRLTRSTRGLRSEGDSGIFEVGSVTLRPLTEQDVGPSWLHDSSLPAP